MFNRQTAQHAVSTVVHEISSFPQASTPNYKVSTAASTVLGVLWIVSKIEGCGSTASNIALVGALLSVGAAINQYGLAKTQLLISSLWSKDKSAATSGEHKEEFHEAATEVDEKPKMH